MDEEIEPDSIAIIVVRWEFAENLGLFEVLLSRFNLLSYKAEKQIELLQERRTALISAAVTGKIDVRDWQPAAA